MVIQALSSPAPALRPCRPVAATASQPPEDTVQLSQTPHTQRQLLWSALETAQLMSGEAVPGPLGKVLTKLQRDGLREVLLDLAQHGARLQPEQALDRLLAGQPLIVQYQGQDWEIHNLADLKDASSLVGAEPVLPAGPALQRLAAAGWGLEVRESYVDNRPASVLDAYRTVTRGSGHVSRSHEVRLAPPAGHPLAEEDPMWAEADQLPAVDYFYGSGCEQGLENPELARGLKELGKEGLTLTCWGSAYGLGDRETQPFSWYTSALKGNTLKLTEHGAEVAETSSFSPADLLALRDEHRDWQRLDQTLLLPAVQSGLVSESRLDDVVREVARPLEGLTREERARAFLDLLATDQEHDFYDVRRLYDDLSGPEALQQARDLTRAVGAESARKAVEYLQKDLVEQIPFEPARQRSQQAFLKLVLGGTETELARTCLELARTRVDGSSFEDCVEELTCLHGAGARQEGYQGLADDYRAVLENRCPGENLARAAAPLRRLLEALSAMGQAEAAREVYVEIRQGLEYGTLTGTEDELLQRFLQTLVLRDNVDEARASLSRPPVSTAPGSVQEGPETVKVGGVVVRRKKTRDCPDPPPARTRSSPD